MVWSRWVRAVCRRPVTRGADGLGEGSAGSGQDEEFLGAGDAGVEQVALQHHPGCGGEGDDDGGVFAALGAVDGDGVGVGEFVEFSEVVVDLLVLVGEDGEGLFSSDMPVTMATVPLKTPALPLS